MTQLIDLTGQRFGMLVVVEHIGFDKRNRSIWRCICDCGNEKITLSHYLRMGDTTTCGCGKKKVGDRTRKPKGESNRNQLYLKYRDHALARSYTFELSIEEFENITRQNCVFCGRAPEQVYKVKQSNGGYLYNGVDRLDNTKGYNLANCVAACGMCNREKGRVGPNIILIAASLLKERGY